MRLYMKKKRRPPHKRNFRWSPSGDAFADAFEEMQRLERCQSFWLSLCHGMVIDDAGKSVAHAWLELEASNDTIVVDLSTGRNNRFRIREYYRRFKPTQVARYKPQQAKCEFLRCRHCGPWC
jgi:hypothetical protein